MNEVSFGKKKIACKILTRDFLLVYVDCKSFLKATNNI
ncbi:hypothetical protein FEDK69T_14290 [Flavobacterium enshiense DK69]|nr:hypothetical protein FEDK69T_14290 [Flavobacterium enshiense DK69]